MINRMAEFLDEQRREALGPVNKWYCSQAYGFEVTAPDMLLAYYIKHGGAQHFRRRIALIPTKRARLSPIDQRDCI